MKQAGFEEIAYEEKWNLKPGGKYVLNHHGTTLYAFTIGENYHTGDMVRMAAAHTDYPCMRIKPNPDFRTEAYAQVNVEVYGGPILNTWFDRCEVRMYLRHGLFCIVPKRRYLPFRIWRFI